MGLEFRSQMDDAWYDARIVMDGYDRLRVKFIGFPDNHDEVFDANNLTSFKDVAEFRRWFRPVSVQVQDNECPHIAKGTLVCVAHAICPDDRRFYDAVVYKVGISCATAQGEKRDESQTPVHFRQSACKPQNTRFYCSDGNAFFMKVDPMGVYYNISKFEPHWINIDTSGLPTPNMVQRIRFGLLWHHFFVSTLFLRFTTLGKDGLINLDYAQITHHGRRDLAANAMMDKTRGAMLKEETMKNGQPKDCLWSINLK